MRKGIEIEVSAADRAWLEAIVADRNHRRKHVERAWIVLLSADGVGTLAIMRRVGCAKPFAWTADPDLVIGKVSRGTQALASIR